MAWLFQAQPQQGRTKTREGGAWENPDVWYLGIPWWPTGQPKWKTSLAEGTIRKAHCPEITLYFPSLTACHMHVHTSNHKTRGLLKFSLFLINDRLYPALEIWTKRRLRGGLVQCLRVSE